MTNSVFIQGDAIICGLGFDSEAVEAALFAGSLPDLHGRTLTDGRPTQVAAADLPPTALRREGGAPETRNNRLALCAYEALPEQARACLGAADPARVGVVIGTSTAGIDEGGAAYLARRASGTWDAAFSLSMQELGDPALFLASQIGATGPAYSVSTACTSGAKAMASAARMIRLGLCDVVLCGGVDTLCDMTLNGFGVLEALSETRCNPFSANRSGIHIGEGAALFVLSADAAATRISGWGESSDAHHISAPDPEGRGAALAMRAALEMANMQAGEIGYLNLHGTATRQNDSMEAAAVNRVFGPDLPCSSTKPLTGHTLGAAGAVEAGLLRCALTRRLAPANRNDGAADPALARLNLLAADLPFESPAAMSCNYAFGGNNVALILERCDG